MGARSDSDVNVHIKGDAKGLKTALGTADKDVAGFAKKALGVGIALVGVREGFEAIGDTLNEADRLGDAMARLDLQLGGDLAKNVADVAGNFSKLGLSKQDVLELGANFADVATALGIADPKIADLADNVAATAAAAGLLNGEDPATIVDQIGKAAGGSEKALKALGVNLSDAEVEARALKDTGKLTADALTDADRATASLELVLEALKPKLDDATTGTGDLEQKQSELQAKVETLSGQLGTALEPALEGVVDFILDMIDAIPHAIDGFEMLGERIEGFARTVLGPLGNVRDVLQAIDDALNPGKGPGNAPKGFTAGPFDEDDVWKATQNHNERNGLTRATGPQIHR